MAWTLVTRANLQFGDAEIRTADAPAALPCAAITSTLLRHRTGNDYIHLLRVVAFTGVNAIGTSNAASGQTVAVATVSIAAQAAGVGHLRRWRRLDERCRAHVPGRAGPGRADDRRGPGHLLGAAHRGADCRRGPIAFTATSAAQPAPGDRWNLAIIELKR